MSRPREPEGGKRSACETGGKPPISALTYAFSIGFDRGHETDDFEARIIETAGPSLLACAAKATRSRRDMQRMRRPGDGQPTDPDAKADGKPTRSR